MNQLQLDGGIGLRTSDFSEHHLYWPLSVIRASRADGLIKLHIRFFRAGSRC